MARLIRTEKEVEGRYTEQWVVVEGDDDALDQWPQGPGEVVGRPAPRQDGHQRARGEALFTADLKLPGMLHTAVLRSPHAHARVNDIDVSRALEPPGVLPRSGRTSATCSKEPPFHGAPVAAVAAEPDRAREALALIDVEWEELEPLLDPEEAVRRSRSTTSRGATSAATSNAGLAEADVVVEAEYRTQTVLHNSMETHQSVRVGRRHARGLHLDAVHLGRPRRGPEQLGLPPDKVRVVCDFMGGGFGAKNGPGDYTFIAIELAEDRAAGALRADAPRGEPRHRQPQRDHPAAERRGARGRDARRARRRVRERDRLVRAARARPTGRWRCSTPATTCAR